MKKIIEKLEFVNKAAFPFLKEEWDFWEIKNTKDLFEQIDWYNDLSDYIVENYKSGLLSYLNCINNNLFSSEMAHFAKELMIAVANAFVNRGSDSKEDKSEVAYNLYKNKEVFRTATNEYAVYAPKLVASILAYACFMHDLQTVEEINEECISKYKNHNKRKKELVDLVRDEFTYNRAFGNLLNEGNVYDHWRVGEYINNCLPKLKFYETNYGETVYENKMGLDVIIELKELKANIESNVYWTNVDAIPKYIEFDYIYPNGSNGDMIKYILEEYGETQQKEATIWTGKISRDYLDLFEVFSREAQYISNDDRFLKIYDHHIGSIIRKKYYDIDCYQVRRYDVGIEIEQYINQHKADQKRIRTDLYSKLILQGQASPKWKSEAQLFAIASSIYPDAVYQYQPDWLGMQSIDIFIPSLAVGIEYQGIQHYKPIEYFGGQRHFEHQQANDKKKKLLCSENNVTLVEWPYTEEVSIDNFKRIMINFITEK